MTVTVQDKELKARHRAMWASGDYARMVETFLLPIGPRLVQACDITTGQQVLDVAAGTGNASIPAAVGMKPSSARQGRGMAGMPCISNAMRWLKYQGTGRMTPAPPPAAITCSCPGLPGPARRNAINEPRAVIGSLY